MGGHSTSKHLISFAKPNIMKKLGPESGASARWAERWGLNAGQQAATIHQAKPERS